MNDTLLILEDEELLASELARHYRNEGWEVALAGSLAAARRQLLEQRVDPQPVWQALAAYDWPGNTRELRNVIERSVLLSNTEVLSSRWLHLGAPGAAPPPPAGTAATVELPLDGSLTIEQMERAILERALRRSDFNVSAAARLLGTTRETLRYRIQKHQLRSDEGQDDQGA